MRASFPATNATWHAPRAQTNTNYGSPPDPLEEAYGRDIKHRYDDLATGCDALEARVPVKHMMMTTVRGRFKTIQATLRGDRDHPEEAGVDATLQVASIDTGVADRDAHLRSPDFFDADKHPTITFRGTRIEGHAPHEEGDRFRLVGDLSIRDTPMEVVLDCEYHGRGVDPWGKTRAGFSFHTEIDRQEWGLKWNQAMETGGVLVANKVRVDGEVQFVRDGE